MAEILTVVANGRPHDVAPGTTLPAFIVSLGLIPTQVVVERNGLALTPGEASAVTLHHGDTLEIVRIVAGG